MCGIIGYTGDKDATERVCTGLEILEYRGYDSVGICAEAKGETVIVKTKGRVSALKAELEKSPVDGSVCAIGHTRWATHGAPSRTNAHPHRVGKTVLVHNGIIENYKELKRGLEEKGVSFLSETDTEIACALINQHYEECADPVSAIRSACREMTGSFAFAVMLDDMEGKIYAVRRGSPLVVAVEEGGCYLASDITAILPFTRVYYTMGEGEIAVLDKGRVTVDSSTEIPWKETDLTFEASQKGGYAHFMLKEMNEQPTAIVGALSPRVKEGLPDFTFDGLDEDFFDKIQQIHIVACGSAMHAGLLGASLIERYSGIPAGAYVASEYRYTPPLCHGKPLVIAISQSGETADTLASLRYAKSMGCSTLSIVNAVETTIAREADYRAYTYAGPEIAVATTKGYATQLALLSLFALRLGLSTGELDKKRARELTKRLTVTAPKIVAQTLKRDGEIREIAEKISHREHLFYIGRGLDCHLAEEAALKLKEISYIHAEAFGAGELKHGTISLIESGTPVIAIATEKHLFDKTHSNVKEVKSRGALTVLICTESIFNSADDADMCFILPDADEPDALFGALTAVQMLAYETAVLRGCDVDKPRNLAKSVTVE